MTACKRTASVVYRSTPSKAVHARALPPHGLLLLSHTGAASLQWAVIGGLGFCIYGPQMLIGLCGAELISPKSVGASQGILGLISYMGAAGAGIPLSYLQVGGGQVGVYELLGLWGRVGFRILEHHTPQSPAGV